MPDPLLVQQLFSKRFHVPSTSCYGQEKRGIRRHGSNTWVTSQTCGHLSNAVQTTKYKTTRQILIRKNRYINSGHVQDTQLTRFTQHVRRLSRRCEIQCQRKHHCVNVFITAKPLPQKRKQALGRSLQSMCSQIHCLE